MKAILSAIALISAMASAAPAPNAPSTMAPNAAPTMAPNATPTIAPNASPQVIAPIDLRAKVAMPKLCVTPKIIGEKGDAIIGEKVIGEKGSDAIIGEKVIGEKGGGEVIGEKGREPAAAPAKC